MASDQTCCSCCHTFLGPHPSGISRTRRDPSWSMEAGIFFGLYSKEFKTTITYTLQRPSLHGWLVELWKKVKRCFWKQKSQAKQGPDDLKEAHDVVLFDCLTASEAPQLTLAKLMISNARTVLYFQEKQQQFIPSKAWVSRFQHHWHWFQLHFSSSVSFQGSNKQPPPDSWHGPCEASQPSGSSCWLPLAALGDPVFNRKSKPHPADLGCLRQELLMVVGPFVVLSNQIPIGLLQWGEGLGFTGFGLAACLPKKSGAHTFFKCCISDSILKPIWDTTY